jgi:hypothetical protein
MCGYAAFPLEFILAGIAILRCSGRLSLIPQYVAKLMSKQCLYCLAGLSAMFIDIGKDTDVLVGARND